MRRTVTRCLAIVLMNCWIAESSAQKEPTAKYPTALILAGRGPDAQGDMNETRILQHFTILEQPNGKGNYISNDFLDEDAYRFEMRKKGDLKVLAWDKVARADAQWVLSSHFGYSDTTVLSGAISKFTYGGPMGVSMAQLQVDERAYGAEKSCRVFKPGAYQGFASGKEANGRLLTGRYDLVWYHRLNAGILTPVLPKKK